MENLFWSIFEKSGDINAFLAYKEYKNNSNSNNFYIITYTIWRIKIYWFKTLILSDRW